MGLGLASVFAAAPGYVGAARESIARGDRRDEDVAGTRGDSQWRAVRRVTLPLAGRGLVAAAVVMWARAVSEFGAIVILTYNPKVVSVLSYDRYTEFGLDAAVTVAAVRVWVERVPILGRSAQREGAGAEETGTDRRAEWCRRGGAGTGWGEGE